MSNLPKVTDASFEEEVVKADLPVVVDFGAEWCGPCRSLDPIVESLAEEYAGKVKFVSVNIDENRATPTQFGIMAVPTLILFRDGELVDKITGFKPRAILEKHLEKLTA
jgi:thioredoxin 1